ncbi:MAG: MerR family transcriptional regulator [Peptostreptococcaceae bacterium]|jgi:putative AdoMet-dependent methyltransferase|nr:MerR family transcriptional regulator [Peptostreptococcaceae bacterium]
MKKYKIKEISDIFNISPNKLRFYEKKGLIKPTRDDINNYRYYDEKNIYKIQLILSYRKLGFSIESIKSILDNQDSKNTLLDNFYNQIQFINNEFEKLKILKKSLEKSMDVIYDSKDNDYIDKILEISKESAKEQNLKNSFEDIWDFDNWAKTYDKSVENNVGSLKIYQTYNDVLNTVYNKSSELKKDKNINILDIGIGTGNLSKLFLDDDYTNIIGLDQSRKMLNVCKNKYPSLKVRLGEFLKIPFDDSKFDLIISTYAFHHLNDEQKLMAIKEMLRVLKHEGLIIIGDLMYENEDIKSKLLDSFDEDELREFNCEFYSDISKLEKEFIKYNKTIETIKIDRLNFVLVIK